MSQEMCYSSARYGAAGAKASNAAWRRTPPQSGKIARRSTLDEVGGGTPTPGQVRPGMVARIPSGVNEFQLIELFGCVRLWVRAHVPDPPTTDCGSGWSVWQHGCGGIRVPRVVVSTELRPREAPKPLGLDRGVGLLDN